MTRNPWLCIAIVGVLGLIALVGVVCIGVGSARGVESAHALISIVSTCIGALSSFLVSVPRGSFGFDSPPPKKPKTPKTPTNPSEGT